LWGSLGCALSTSNRRPVVVVSVLDGDADLLTNITVLDVGVQVIFPPSSSPGELR
jgi:hypothetical protein